MLGPTRASLRAVRNSARAPYLRAAMDATDASLQLFFCAALGSSTTTTTRMAIPYAVAEGEDADAVWTPQTK